jgi:hypothetical protein
MLEACAVKVDLRDIADDFGGNCKEDDQADHDERRLAKGKGEHGNQDAKRKGDVGGADAFELNQVVAFVGDKARVFVGFGFDGFEDGEQVVGEDAGVDVDDFSGSVAGVGSA